MTFSNSSSISSHSYMSSLDGKSGLSLEDTKKAFDLLANNGYIGQSEFNTFVTELTRMQGQPSGVALSDVDCNEDGKISSDEWNEMMQFLAEADGTADETIERSTWEAFMRGEYDTEDCGCDDSDEGSDMSFPSFSTVDKNNNGAVDLAEWNNSGVKLNFNDVDANSDGVVSKQEYEAKTGQPYPAFSSVDGNNNGAVDLAEWNTSGVKMNFNDVDTNSDGVVSKQEYEAKTGQPNPTFDSIDANDNGAADLAEWNTSGVEMNFNDVDTNTDSVVSKQEYEAKSGSASSAASTTPPTTAASPAPASPAPASTTPPASSPPATASTTPPPASSTTPPPATNGSFPMFTSVDGNNNGAVDLAEWNTSGVKLNFNDVDTNTDGVVSKQEYEAKTAQTYPAFTAVDGNNNGAVDLAEWNTSGVKMNFNDVDTNSDGVVSKQEYEAKASQPTPLFATVDGNSNGAVDLAEWNTSGVKMNFNDVDTNSDGVVSKQEYEAKAGSTP